MPKLGDINPEDGSIWWSKLHGWLSPEKFAQYRIVNNRARIAFSLRHPNRYREDEIKNHDRNVAKRKAYYQNNKPAFRARAKIWEIANPDKVRAMRRMKQAKMIATNPAFRARVLIGNRIKFAIRRCGSDKTDRTVDLIGCSYKELKEHIELRFKSGMSWDNWGKNGWHVDHKIPLSAARNIEELKILCHYTNLQPLWAIDNMMKSGKFNREEADAFIVKKL